MAGTGHTDRWNSLLAAAAARGNLEEAQAWAEKLAHAGRELYVNSFNTMLRAYTNASDLEAAEFWFWKLKAPLLHPELSGLQANAETYNVMVEAFAAQGDLPRAESYARASQEAGFGSQLSRKSYDLLVDACLAQNDPRRAHLWMEAMVEAGHKKLRKGTVQKLIYDLTSLGNPHSAGKWLAYMSDMGLTLDAETYSRVKDALPMEVVPCCLSGEYGGALRAAGVVPAKLKGELASISATDKRPIREASVVLPPRSPRVASARWPDKLATEVRDAATKRMPPHLKEEFIKAAGTDGERKTETLSVARSPRKRYYSGGHHVQYSRVPPITWPAESKFSNDSTCHPYWLELGPSARTNPLYGGE